MNSELCKLVVTNIRKELKDYLTKYKLKSLIIGESGGIDSAISTALAEPICKELGVKLIGREITIETNKPEEIERGNNIGTSFCDDYKEIDLTDSYFVMKDATMDECSVEETDRETKVRLGNIKARMRMVYLYNLAQQNRGIVVSTDNFTEFLLGFWTLHGDVGDYGMIQELWKHEVYSISQYLVDYELENEDQKDALQACIDCVPTDGLGITNSDLDQLEASTYDEVDDALKSFIASGEIKNEAVIKRHKASAYKRSNPFNLKRETLFQF